MAMGMGAILMAAAGGVGAAVIDAKYGHRAITVGGVRLEPGLLASTAAFMFGATVARPLVPLGAGGMIYETAKLGAGIAVPMMTKGATSGLDYHEMLYSGVGSFGGALPPRLYASISDDEIASALEEVQRLA